MAKRPMSEKARAKLIREAQDRGRKVESAAPRTDHMSRQRPNGGTDHFQPNFAREKPLKPGTDLSRPQPLPTQRSSDTRAASPATTVTTNAHRGNMVLTPARGASSIAASGSPGPGNSKIDAARNQLNNSGASINVDRTDMTSGTFSDARTARAVAQHLADQGHHVVLDTSSKFGENTVAVVHDKAAVPQYLMAKPAVQMTPSMVPGSSAGHPSLKVGDSVQFKPAGGSESGGKIIEGPHGPAGNITIDTGDGRPVQVTPDRVFSKKNSSGGWDDIDHPRDDHGRFTFK